MSSAYVQQRRKNAPDNGLAPAGSGGQSAARLQLKTMDMASQKAALKPVIQKKETGGGDSLDTAAPAEQAAPIEAKGNAAGAAAMATAARKMEAVFTQENFDALGIGGLEQVNLFELLDLARTYSSEGLVHLVTEDSVLPPAVAARFGGESSAAAVFDQTSRIIFIRESVETDSGFNSVIHELSHASRVDTKAMKDYRKFDEAMKDEPVDAETPTHFYNRLNFYLLLAREEREAEAAGHLGALTAQVDSQGGEATGNQPASSAGWQARELSETSSAVAEKQWLFHFNSASQQDFIKFKYKALALSYLVGKGPFPDATEYKISKN